MIEYIRKRHEGDGWCVFSELANGTGYKVKGWADAAALGIWPSRGYELHGFEFKASREDLKKELRDPAKADNVGRYCHYWWLVLTEEKLMDGLVVPATWGVLVPKSGVLRTVRKAPRVAKPKPFDAAFVAAMIRNVTKTWVPKHEHEALKNQRHQETEAALAQRRAEDREDAAHELKRLKAAVEAFELASGVKIENYGGPRIGEAVRTVLDIHNRNQLGHEALEHHVRSLQRSAEHHAHLATTAKDAAARLRELIDQPVRDPDEVVVPPRSILDELQRRSP